MLRSDAELIGCLQATLSPDGEVRHAAEAALQSGSTQEGFCIGLINIALHATGVEVGIRQLAAVVLRRNVQQRWIVEDFENAGAESRQISDAEKSQVRALLPAGLAESNSRIQTAVGMAIAEIGRWDCPAHWPELLPGLVHAINEPNNPALVAGAVRCLSMLVEDLGEGQVVEIAPVVLPPLLRFATAASDPGSSSSLRRRALLIFKTALGSLELVYRQEGNAMQVAMAVLPPWMQALTAIVATPTTAHDPGAWGVKFDALGCLVRIVSSFSKLAEDYIPAAMSATWEMFSSLLPLYQTHVLHSEASNIEGEVAPNEDEAGLDAVSLPELVSQLFEFIMALVGHPKWSTAIRPSFRQLAYLTLGYIQASDADVEQWSTDVNSFLGAEEDFWGPRASGELLLEEITKSSQGMAVVAEAIAARAGESAAARHAGDKDWWRLREAVLLALGYIVGNVIERRTAGKSVPHTLQAESISSGLLNQDIVPGVPPLVAGRAMWLLARLEPMLGPAARAAALRAVGPMLAPGCPGQTQAGACQALARLCRSAEPADIQSVSFNAFAGLCALLPGAEEDSLHLLLETLAALVRADPATAVQYENQLVPGALAAWVNHVNDPLISEDAAALLQSLASSPACLAVLSARALPTLCDVIANPAPHSPILVSGCLDMLVMLLPPSAPDAAKTICSVAFRPVLALVAGADDEEVLASATAVLRTMLQVGGQDALLWGGFGDGSAGVGALLQAMQFLMRPQVHDRACRHVGGLLLELMRHAMPLVVRSICFTALYSL
jgi:importin-9